MSEMNVVIRGFLTILVEIGIDINICSCCGKGKMITKEKLDRQNYSPPGGTNKIA